MLIFGFRWRFGQAFQMTLSCLFSLVVLVGCDDANHKPSAELNSPTNDFYNATSEVLKANFKQAPEQVKPWVYWYWVSDHISKTGIENDLKAMQRIGINTAFIGIVHMQGERGKVKSLTEEWWEHLRFAIKKAAAYDIDIGLFNSPGWSQSGGPWVTLDKSMRYLDSQEIQFSGPQTIHMEFDKPAEFFQDVRVLAFKTPLYEQIRLEPQNTKISVSTPSGVSPPGEQKLASLIDGNRNTVYTLPSALLDADNKNFDKSYQLQIDFKLKNAFQARTIEIFPNSIFRTHASLLAMNSAGEFELVKSFDVQRPKNDPAIGPDHDAPIVISFPAVESKHYRLQFNKFDFRGRAKATSAPGFKDINLSRGYKLERYVEKKLAKVHPKPQPKFDSYLWPDATAVDNPDMLINATQVIDITGHVNDGKLRWQMPEGDWTIARYFMRPTGTTNGPSSAEAKGPEIDKLSKPIAQFHFDAYIGKILNSMAPSDRTALKYAVVDSYERGAQNWTDGFAETFEQQFGYDPIPYLPVYTGRAVNSVEQSERFLWDMRRMVADRVSYQYAAGLRERANENGMKLWIENYGHWGFPGEFLQYGGQADIVSGEFWATGNLGAIELKAASSAAHIYGQKTVMSESFTANAKTSYAQHPWSFKKRADWSFVEGVNHTLLHVYIHQAYDHRFPGVNAWFGSEFNRNNTWFEYMGGWLDYVKRANYMMQQGRYVADIMYFIGEDVPKMTGEINPSLPNGYSYDFINAEVILERLSVRDGMFQLPDGMVFKLLVLPNSVSMRPAVLKKIQQLVKEGGTIYGPPPERSPSLQNFPEADRQVQAMAKALWQNIDGNAITHSTYGKGKVFYNSDKQGDLSAVLTKIDSSPDVSGLPKDLIWSHRSSDNHDIYFVANQTGKRVAIYPSFRASGQHLQPQRWDAVTGETYDIAQFEITNGRIKIPVELNPFESSFFVFSKSSTASKSSPSIIKIAKNGQDTWLPSVFDKHGKVVAKIGHNGSYQFTRSDGSQTNIEIKDIPPALRLSQPWQLTFQANRDVPTSLSLNTLVSLTELEPLSLKYYSGTVVYNTQFTLDKTMLRSDYDLQLNLGEVGVVARVKLNGINLGDLWSRPLMVDINKAVKSGVNQLEIEVATNWKNRLLGDFLYPEKFPDSEVKKAFSTSTTFAVSSVKKEDALPQASGLIGPVTINAIRRVKLQ